MAAAVAAVAASLCAQSCATVLAGKPNVIMLLTDDQVSESSAHAIRVATGMHTLACSE
jgi:hypothetical protein